MALKNSRSRSIVVVDPRYTQVISSLHGLRVARLSCGFPQQSAASQSSALGRLVLLLLRNLVYFQEYNKEIGNG